MLFRQNPSSSMMLCTDNTVLSFNFSSFSKRSFMTSKAGSIGTEVNSEVTSYEVRHSPSWRVMPLSLDTKSLVLCIWWGIYLLCIWVPY